jgi:hypothetical protein
LSIIFIIFCFILEGVAQSRWQIGGYVLPGISRQHTLENEDKFPLWEYPRSRFSYGAGFSLYRKLGKSSWLQTGIGLARRQFFSYSELAQQDSSGNRHVLDTLRTSNNYSDLGNPIAPPGKARKGKDEVDHNNRVSAWLFGSSISGSIRLLGYLPNSKIRPNFSGMNHISFWFSTGGALPDHIARFIAYRTNLSAQLFRPGQTQRFLL